MKKYVLFVLLLGCFSSKAQSFKVAFDTMYIHVTGDTIYRDDVINLSSSYITIDWQVISTNFPSDWQPKILFCDNVVCYGNIAYYLWPSKNVQRTDTIWAGTSMFFDFVPDLSTTTSRGCYYVTVRMNNAAIPTDTAYETFMIKCPTGVNSISAEASNIKIYPNPAVDNLNISYSSSAGVEKIVLYNLLGEEVASYNAASPNYTNIKIPNLATGMYFVRFINETGNVLAIQKFLKE